MAELDHKGGSSSGKQPRFFFKGKTPSGTTKHTDEEEECNIQNLILHKTRPGVTNCNNCSNPSRLPVVKIARMHEIDLSTRKAERKRRSAPEDSKIREQKRGSPEGEVDIHGCKLTAENVTSFDPNSTAAISCNNCSEIILRPLAKNTDAKNRLS